MMGPARRLLLAPVVGLLALASAGIGAADPDPVEMPEIVSVIASCDYPDSSVQVWFEHPTDDPVPVRLDRLRPTTSTHTENALYNTDKRQHGALFKNVSAGEYNVHVDGRDGVQDDVLVVVKPCTDLKPTDEILTIQVECKAGWGFATIQVANPNTKEVVVYTLNVLGNEKVEDIELSEGMSLRVVLNALEDKEHTATLTGSGVNITKKFTVKCEKGNAPKLDTKVACTGTTGGVDVTVFNPNREAVTYTAALKGQSKSVKVGGGEKGTVNFAGVPAGEHPVKVTGDGTEANTVAKVSCGTTTTSTTPTSQPTTTTTPAPQGRSDSGLANTGASVGGLITIGGLVIISGVALLLIVRRRRA